MKKQFIKPIWKDADVRMVFDKLGKRAESMFIDLLKRTGEEFVTIARRDGNYIDHTGNLRSSIGYVVLKNGRTISRDFQMSNKKGTDKVTGLSTVKKLSSEIASLYPLGYVLIGLAGMKYAVYVEAMENKDVIGFAVEKSEDFIRSTSTKLLNRIRNTK